MRMFLLVLVLLVGALDMIYQIDAAMLAMLTIRCCCLLAELRAVYHFNNAVLRAL